MNEIEVKIIINISIFLIVFIGFFVYMKKNTDWFEKGGFFYELRNQYKKYREEKNIKSKQKNKAKNENETK